MGARIRTFTIHTIKETLTEDNVSRLEELKQQLQGKLSTLRKIGAEFLSICDLEDIEREIMDPEAKTN